MTTVFHQLSLDTLGGVEALFYDYLHHSPRQRFNHHLILGSRKILPKYELEIRRLTQSVNHSKHWMGMRIPKCLNALRQFYHGRLLKHKKSDLLLFWNSFNEAALVNAAKGNNCPVIYYDHGAAFSHPASEKNGAFLKKISGAICCSQASKRILELRWNYQGPIQVIRNPLRPSLQGKMHSPKSLLPSQPIKLGVVGRLVPVKGTCLVLHALKLLIDNGIDAELHVVGEGIEKHNLIETAKKLKITSRVHFRGLIFDISSLYQEIDMLICPSIREPFGLVALEAAAHGCPVICSRIDGLPEIIKNGKMGYCLPQKLPLIEYGKMGGHANPYTGDCFDPDSNQLVKPGLIAPDDIKNSIQALINHPQEYAQMSKNCIITANEDFGFSDYVENLEKSFIHYSKRDAK